MHGFSIRTAQPGDLPALDDVYRRSSLSNAGDRADLLAHPDALLFDGASVHEGRTRAAFEGERVVGFATLRTAGMAAELEDLFVDPNRMRRGVGRLLVVDAANIVRSSGIPRIDVVANAHAVEFYVEVGFVRDGSTTTQFGLGHRLHLDVPTA